MDGVIADPVQLCLVPVADVDEVLIEVAHWVQSAIVGAPAFVISFDEIRDKLSAGAFRLLLVGRGDKVYGAMVYELRPVEQKIFFWIIAAGGAIGETMTAVGSEMFRGVCAFARAQGAEALRLVGRPGWARWCRRQGLKVRDVRVKQVLLEVRI